MSVIDNKLLLAGDDGYKISRSVRLRSSASAFFNRTPAGAGNRQVMTFSWWMKLGNTAGAIFGAPATTNPRMQIYYNGPSDGRFELYQSDGGGSQVCYTLTTARYRDPSAWYHFVIAIDTTQATSSNRIKWYVNGVQLTAFDTAAYPAQNTNMEWNAAAVHNIGRQPNGGSYWDGYMTEINFIDGQALTPSSFGETDSLTGVWKPKKYAGTYGTNGFYLNFSDPSAATAAAIGKDSSGNGNNWTPNNISVTAGVTYDSMLDTPTPYADGGNGRGNYSVANPLTSLSARTSLSAANLQLLGTSSSESGCDYGTIGVTSGKWYWENTVLAVSSASSYPNVGAVRTLYGPSNAKFIGDSFTNGVGIFTSGTIYKENSLVTTASTYTTNDVIGVALDLDNLTCAFYKNNTLLYTVTGLTAGTYWAGVGSYYNSSTAINFGQRPFAYTPPTGYKALNTQNLPDGTIVKGNKHFDVSLWTGDGASSRAITNSGGFQPDLVWTKARSGASNLSHNLVDSVRGAGLSLFSDQTTAETSLATGVTAFNSNGFQIGSWPNVSSSAEVGWQWKAGGTAVSNTAGSITSQVSANTTAGFSVVTYTGTGAAATVGHGLGVAPKMVIVKSRNPSGAFDWAVWHSALSATEYLILNGTAAKVTGSTIWNSATPSSTVFSLGNAATVNESTKNLVAYCFSEVAGYSKFGSYTGNGSADGPFVYCGFRPRFVMWKISSGSTGDWYIIDSSRDTYNVASSTLWPDLSNAEGTGANLIDFVSNGFKIRNSGGSNNGSGYTFIFAAFAESPFKVALAR